VDYKESLTSLVAGLPLQERQVVVYRFFGNMTQTQIGERVGVSQVQVSRLLVRAVRRLRAGLLAGDPPPVPG
jgi:RNA polymerase sigma-B factor